MSLLGVGMCFVPIWTPGESGSRAPKLLSKPSQRAKQLEGDEGPQDSCVGQTELCWHARRGTGLVGRAGEHSAASRGSGPVPKFGACAPGQPWRSHSESAEDPQRENRNGYETNARSNKWYCCHRSVLLAFVLTSVPALNFIMTQ